MQEKKKTAPENKPQETKKEIPSWQDMKYEQEKKESNR